MKDQCAFIQMCMGMGGALLINRSYEAVTKRSAVLQSTGETYAELAVRRQQEAEHRAHPTGPNPTSGHA
jgi:hypothetical protein